MEDVSITMWGSHADLNLGPGDKIVIDNVSVSQWKKDDVQLLGQLEHDSQGLKMYLAMNFEQMMVPSMRQRQPFSLSLSSLSPAFSIVDPAHVLSAHLKCEA